MSTDPETIAMLRDSAERYAQNRYDFLQRHAILAEPAGYSAKAWQDYAELGWLALRLPEDDGGLDADAVAICALMEVVGTHLLMEPLLASAVLCTGLVVKQGSAAQKALLLPALADGALKLAFACDEDPAGSCDCGVQHGGIAGGKFGVRHGDIADRLIVSARDEAGEWMLCLVDAAAAQVQRQSYRLVDGRGAANCNFDAAPFERLGPGERGQSAAEAIAEIRDEAAVALCAEALGAVCSLLAATCEYLKVRQQFGRPIGANQALQHRMVDLYLIQEEIKALTRAAQRALTLPAAARARTVSGARAYITQAARRVANEAVQMHGGVGITEELEVSHHFRRLMVIGALFGGRDEHFARFVDAALAETGEAA
jgi:alkylation response protein AidB-like acyl-CoA dehydrogenase